MIGLELIPYRRESHADFVVGTFKDWLLEGPPWRIAPVLYKRALERLLRDPEATVRIAVPRGHRDEFIGWAIGWQGSLVFAYVKYVMRRKGVAAALIAGLGLAPSPPVAFWSRTCARMAHAGRPIWFDSLALERIMDSVKTERTAA